MTGKVDAGESTSAKHPSVLDGVIRDDAAEEACPVERLSYRNPDHLHICTALNGHPRDDGHVCPCGDWWHD